MATNIFQRKAHDGQEKKAEALAKFKISTSYAAEMAAVELPRAEEGFHRVDRYKNEVFGDCPESELPTSIRQILGQIAGIRGTPGTVRAALAERERIQAKDLTPQWAPFVTANILQRLSFARGCAASIDRHFMRLKLEVDRFRNLHDATYDTPKTEARRPSPAPLVKTPPAQRVVLTNDTNE